MISAKLKPSDEARFARALQKLVAISGEPVEEIMRKQGRLFAVDAARFTNRVGNTPAAGRSQKGRIGTDIGRVYKNARSAIGLIAKEFGLSAARRFENYIRRRNISKAQVMVDRANLSSRYYGGRPVRVSMWDGGAAHTRFQKRRLRGGNPVLLIFDYNNVKKFKTLKKKHAGALKAGWAKAAQDLGGTRGIPAYAKKGHKTRGHGSVKGKGGKAVLRVTNRSNYIIQNTSAPKLWRLRTKNIEKVVDRMLKRKTKQITRSV